MAADEPPYLTIGTDVSAKYKGAFCEAKIKKVNRVVKCKVTFKNNLGTFMVTDDLIKGPLRIGADVEARHPEKTQFIEAVINKLQDYSQYTVVFDDGDETTLRRTSLCLKSGRHFAESPTLDQFPLTNPEHFGTPVIGTSKFKRKRRSTMNSSLDYESSDEENVPRKLKAIRDKEHNPDLGRVVCVDFGDRRKKDNWYPGLIVPAQSTVKLTKEEHLVRSFKDGKYYQVPKKDIREFYREAIQKVENNSLKLAVEKAINYLEKDELPPHWEKALFSSLDSQSADEDSHDSDSDTSDDEPSEEKDRFVAQLYKFMDERGTPINKAPIVSNRDLNLYKLFKIMHKLGGYNKVTNKNKWKIVYSKMGLPSANLGGPNQIKTAYKRFLQSFEDFYRKLGCTMVSNSRSTRGRHRSDRNFIVTRTRDRESPKGRNSKDCKEKAPADKKNEEKSKASSTDRKETKLDEPLKQEEKEKNQPKSPEKKKTVEKPRADEKDERRKREDKPRLIRSTSLNKKDEKKETTTPTKGKEVKEKDVAEKARTREDARKEKNESPEKKGTRSNSKIEQVKKEKEELKKDKPSSLKEKEKKDDKPAAVDEKAKVKKDEKSVRERKPIKEKKVEEKSVVKEKRENPPREKKEDKSIKDKSEPIKEAAKPKKEEPKRIEEKSPKRKMERLSNQKKEEKVAKSRNEEKPALPDASKKVPIEDPETKSVKEEKSPKCEVEVKKEEPKDKLRPKLRDRKEDCIQSEDEATPSENGEEGLKDDSQDGFEKKVPPGKPKSEEGEEPPNKGKRKPLKLDEKDDKESLTGLSDSDESFTTDSEKLFSREAKHNEIEVGDRVKVKYGRGRLQKVYEAKVLKVEMDGTEKRFYVHYAGWNTRYDEWVRKSYIVANISCKQKDNSKTSSSPTNTKKVDRGRPPGMLANTRPDRKNSTGSVSSSRAMRSEKKIAPSYPPSRGPESGRRSRKKSNTATSATDVSQESDTDGMDMMDLEDDDADSFAAPPSSFKEELFSDDEEKEKLEDAKRGDITELEKAITVEESGDGIKMSIDGNSISEDMVNNMDIKTPAKQAILSEEESNVPFDSNSSDGKCSVMKAEKNKSAFSEGSVLSHLDALKPTTVFPSVIESKVEKIADMSMTSSNSPSVSACSVNLGKYIPTHTIDGIDECKSTLSFAGLIKKSPEKADNSPKPVHVESTYLTLLENEKNDLENKPISSSNFKSSPIFDEDLNSPQNSESMSTNGEKFDSKSISNLFESILKPTENESKDSTKSGSSESNKGKSLVPSEDSKKSVQNASLEKLHTVGHGSTVEETNESKILSPARSSENVENKPKDCFDILLQDGSNFDSEPPKMADSKDDIFSFTFSPHNPSKDNVPLDDSYNKLSSSDSLYRIKPKPSETVDVSKMIPGILERLKKDVVADVSDSPPPPPKEELNFDFLRSSQNTSKCLSRSDSSNSLRICESDTNDSNVESKELLMDEKFEMALDDNSISHEEKSGKTTRTEPGDQKAKPSSNINNDLSEEKDLSSTQKSLVITALNDMPISFGSDKDSSVADTQKEPLLFSERNASLNNDVKSEICDTSSVKSSASLTDLSIAAVNLSHDNLSSLTTSTKQEVTENISSEVTETVKEKEETEKQLFDEIKSSSPNLNQNSVIKFTYDATVEKIDESKDSEEILAPIKEEVKKEDIESQTLCTNEAVSIVKEDNKMNNMPEKETIPEIVSMPEEDSTLSLVNKKEIKKKKLGKKIGKKFNSEISEKDETKSKEPKTKSKKRLKLESGDWDKLKSLDMKSKSKKLKKNKNKKRFLRHEDYFGENSKKADIRDDEHHQCVSDKIKRREKKRNDKKFLKCGLKSEDDKGELTKKKKSKKNRDKLMSDKKDFFEKKTKKKRKLHLEDNQDTDSEKETLCKIIDSKKRKRKKFKVKECSSSDDGGEKIFKEKSSKDHTSSLMRQDSKSDDPDMSFLLCEEKVPASPAADLGDDTSGSSSIDERINSEMDLLPNVYPCSSGSNNNRESSISLHKHSIDNVLDNTPPTTPSSTESLLSSSPSHERDSFPMNYPESTQSGESDLFHSSRMMAARGSEEYHAATTLAFAVCKSVSESRPLKDDSFSKRQRGGESASSSKRKKKRVQRYPESSKSPKHKSSFPRVPKMENYCEDSSCTSPAASSSPPYGNISTLNFSRSLPNRLSEGSSSRYFYVPLHEKDPEKRIAVLQEKMAALRKRYMALRAEVIAIDHKRRKARKKVREAAGIITNPSAPSEDGNNGS